MELTKLTFTKDMLIRKTKICESLLLSINFDNEDIPRNKRKKQKYINAIIMIKMTYNSNQIIQVI